MKKIILASGSPRRKMLMEMANLSFEVIVIPTDENFPAHFTPREAAIHIAKNKAIAIKNIVHETSIIVAADTMVIVDNIIIGKPVDREDAINILTKLSGKTHQVITGVYISDNQKEHHFYESTEVTFKHLTQEQITYYIDTAKPYDKAGAYAIQEWIGAVAITSIKGDYYNVMGLPINRVFDILNKMGS